MKKSIRTELTPINIAKIMDLLTATPVKLKGLSKSLTDEQLREPLAAGERSFIEIIAHLINSEARLSESLYLALLMDKPLIVDIHSEKDWGKLLRFDLFEFNDLLAYFTLRRKALLRVLSGLKDKDWERVVREKKKKRNESVYWRTRSLALHEAEHLKEIEERIE